MRKGQLGCLGQCKAKVIPDPTINSPAKNEPSLIERIEIP
jgi:hypothetical protein